MNGGHPPIPQLPGGPDPAGPVPRSPVDGIDLAGYARIAAALAERSTPRARVLAEHRLDELRWLEVEKTWLLRVAAAALQGDLALGEELDRAYAAAQAALGPPEPARSLEEYAVLSARIEAGEPAPVVLAGAGLSLSDWARLSRAWAAAMAGDPALADAYRRARATALAGPTASTSRA